MDIWSGHEAAVKPAKILWIAVVGTQILAT
jgi:hypothetical protein